MERPEGLEVIIFKEPNKNEQVWVAQCLQYDIAASATKIEDALFEFERMFVGQIAADIDSGLEPLENVPPAPQEFRALFNRAKLEVSSVPREFRFSLIPNGRPNLPPWMFQSDKRRARWLEAA